MGRGKETKLKHVPNLLTSTDINHYLEFYGIHREEIEHGYEFLKYGEEKIFIQSFTPSTPIGMVIVVHGYLDHSGSMRNLINDLLHKQYQVVTYDLQGHGLSSGARAEIIDFHDYVEVFHEVNQWAKRKTALPVHVVAHSTGGAIIIDYLLRKQATFQKVILVSPLIRSHQWYLSKLGIRLIKPFVNQLTRVFKRNSSDSTYLDFVKQDPLQHHKLPIVWFEALRTWNKKVKDYKKSYEEVLVIQGDRDRTVDWNYNLTFIQKKFPNCQVRLIHGGDHQLLNEHPRLLNKTLFYIHQGLKE
ncbi:MAG: alpha/beta hydrolase [Bacillota bacterium]